VAANAEPFLHSHHPARRLAIDILYQADIRSEDPRAALQEWMAAGHDVPEFARELVEGVAAHRAELDELLGRHATGWTVHRMAVVDRTILRVACYELLHRPDVPTAAAINEAVEAAKELSTEDSGRFVNGILGRIAAGLGERGD
jgi:transcription antitermination protein NusB